MIRMASRFGEVRRVNESGKSTKISTDEDFPHTVVNNGAPGSLKDNKDKRAQSRLLSKTEERTTKTISMSKSPPVRSLSCWTVQKSHINTMGEFHSTCSTHL